MSKEMRKNHILRGVLLCLVLLFIFQFIPEDCNLVVFAGNDFTIKFEDETVQGTIRIKDEIDGVDVTAEISSGSAVFSNFEPIQGKKYKISITGMTQYQDYSEEKELSGNALTILINELREKNYLPTIELTSDLDGWKKEDVNVSGIVKENGSPVADAKIVVSEKSLSDDEVRKADASVIADHEGKFNILCKERGENEYFLYAVNSSDEVSKEERFAIKIDSEPPKIDKMEFKEETKVESGTIHYYDDLTLTVTASDEVSGIGNYILYKDKIEYANNTSGEFKLGKEDFKERSQISVIVSDKAGNKAELIQSDYVQINAAKPKIQIDMQDAAYESQNKLWYDKKEIEVNAAFSAGENAKLVSVPVVTVNSKSVDVSGIKDWQEGDESARISFHADLVEGENTIYIKIENNFKNEFTIEQKVYVDTLAPDDVHFVYKDVKELLFGTFDNKKVKIEVAANDLPKAKVNSGVKSITLYIGENEYKKEVNSDGKCTFEVPKEKIEKGYVFKQPISAKANDNVGNETEEIKPNRANSNIYNYDYLMIENVYPVATIQTENGYKDSDGKLWFGNDANIRVNVSDSDSGIRSVVIKVNDQKLEKDKNNKRIRDDYYKDTAMTKTDSYEINSSQVNRNQDGSYVVELEIVDNAGNRVEKKTTVYKDAEDPYIEDIEFSPKGIQESKGKDLSSSVRLKSYGFYFTKDTTVTIKAKDNEPSAGIDSITYYLVNKDAPNEKKEVTAKVKNNKVSFVVKKNFKGQIFAKSADHVGHVTKAYVTPDGAIIESPTKHDETSDIIFSKPKTNLKDINGLDLYAKNTNVKIVVKDNYSGIKKVEWAVIAPFDINNNQKGSLELNKDGTYVSGSHSSGWEKTKKDNNLVTEMTKTITVKNNSNAIVLNVKLTDRSGNTSEKKINFSIDKTRPTIKVTYDNNADDSDNKNYFNKDRIATIEITERNFDPKNVVYKVTNSDGIVPKLVGWKTIKNKNNPDLTVHRATIKYTADGDYSFDISYKDNAGNAAPPFRKHKFTMDQTNPIIQVSYNLNDEEAKNGNYYSEERVATITIDEHNFDAGRVKITGKATDDGVSITFPKESSWTTNGDKHTATLTYSEDALYRFDIDYTDMAGNESADYVVDEFYVDKTKPDLSITGVANKSANKGKVAPIITYTDTNYDEDGLNISLTGVQNGKKLIVGEGEYTEIKNGKKFSFNNFKKKQEMDDIYTLTAKAVDYAGNETKKTISFSVNRFGSIYVFDESLQAMDGKYVKDAVDVVLTETNADTLKKNSVHLKITKNGTPIDLIEEVNYDVDKISQDGEWCQYRYTIYRSLFKDDGKYTVELYSEDRAGNINENTDTKKKKTISFGVDKTAPVIIPIDFESGNQYPVEKKDITMSVKDNLLLDKVKIFVNGHETEYQNNGEDYMFTVASSNSVQNAKIIATDAAGNVLMLDVEDFLISTNVFARWFNNTPLFVGSLAGIGLFISVAVAVFFLFIRRRNKNKQVESI